MAVAESKRDIPDGLKKILAADVKLSKEFVELVNKNYPISSFRAHLKSLEVRIRRIQISGMQKCILFGTSCTDWLEKRNNVTNA